MCSRLWYDALFFFIGSKLLYYVLLVSTMQQCGSALSTHRSLPPWASRQPTAPPPSRLGCHRARGWTPWSMKQLSLSHLFYTRQSLYFRATLSICSTLSLPQCAHKCVFTSAFLFLPLKEVHQSYCSRFHAYVLIYNICFSLPDLPHSM